MKVTRYTSRWSTDEAPGKSGLALCGGGLTGALVEVGVLAGLDDLLGAHVSTRFDAVVGTSAGASVAALVSQGVPGTRLYRALDDERDAMLSLRRKDVYRYEPARWIAGLARLGWRAGRSRLRQALGRYDAAVAEPSLFSSLPAGLFRIDPFVEWLEALLARNNLSSSFRNAIRELYVVAHDLDSGRRLVFGEPELADVPLPLAIAASSAIPVFFEPVRVGERDCLDGGVGRVGHVDVLVRHGATRIVVVHPMAPVRNETHGENPRLKDHGLAAINGQAARIQSRVRLHLGLKKLVAENPNLDILLVEPGEAEAQLLVGGSMNLRRRREILQRVRRSAREALAAHLDRLRFLAPECEAFSVPVGGRAVEPVPLTA